MPSPANAKVTVRFAVKVPAYDYEAKMVAAGDSETENQMVYRAKALLDAVPDPFDDTEDIVADISSIRTSRGEEL